MFNCVIDEVLCAFVTGTGYTITGRMKINCMAFADDLITISSTIMGQQRLLDKVSGELNLGGLALNPAKCATLNIAIDGEAKRWLVDARSRLVLDGEPLTQLSILDTYKYMGLQTVAQGSLYRNTIGFSYRQCFEA